MSRAAFVAVVLLALAGVPAAAAEKPAVVIVPTRAIGNVFGGQEVEYRLRVDVKNAWKGRLIWRLSAGQRSVAAGEVEVDSTPEKPAVVPIALPVPPIRDDGAAISLKLTATLVVARAGKPDATWEKDVWVFPKNPFADRTEWLKSLKLTVFDPPGATVKALNALSVPFEEQANAAGLADLTGGVLVIGEGVSLKEYPGMAMPLVKVASRGVTVLILAPANGELAVPGVGETDRPTDLTFRDDPVRSLDKRLDPSPLSVARLTVRKSEDGGVVGVVPGKAGDWPWVEAKLAGSGRWMYCGYAIIEKWDESPTGRFLFSRTLEHLTKGRSNADE